MEEYGIPIIAERIKKLREDAGVSQLELARSISVAQSSIGNYERGERLPDAYIVLALAKYFNVSTDYLLGRSKYKNPSYSTIIETTGLDDAAIDSLKYFQQCDLNRVLSYMLVQEEFEEFIKCIHQFAKQDDSNDLKVIYKLTKDYPNDDDINNLVSLLKRLPLRGLQIKALETAAWILAVQYRDAAQTRLDELEPVVKKVKLSLDE